MVPPIEEQFQEILKKYNAELSALLQKPNPSEDWILRMMADIRLMVEQNSGFGA